MRVGDTLNFKKFQWIITQVKKSPYGVIYGKYMVKRKYFSIHLKFTDCTYEIHPQVWDYYKRRLEENSNYHYTMR